MLLQKNVRYTRTGDDEMLDDRKHLRPEVANDGGAYSAFGHREAPIKEEPKRKVPEEATRHEVAQKPPEMQSSRLLVDADVVH